MLSIKDLKLALSLKSIATRGLSDTDLVELAYLNDIISHDQLSEFRAFTAGGNLVEQALEQTPPEQAPEQTPTPTQGNNTMTTPTPTNATQNALEALINTLTPQAPQLDESRILELIQEHAKVSHFKITNTTTNKTVEIKDTTLHNAFKKSLNQLSVGNDLYFYGRTGAGKSTTAKHLAKALDTDCYIQGAILTKFEALGSLTATGYNKSTIRKWLENEDGGLLCIDELDACDPRALVTLMGMFDHDGSLAFPDGETFTRTDNHKIIVTANTIGAGASAMYSGRIKLDGATLNRFVRIEHDYCENVERSLADDKLVTYIRAFRDAVASKGFTGATITPRTIVQASKVFNSDFSALEKDDMLNDILRQGMTPQEFKAVQSLAGSY